MMKIDYNLAVEEVAKMIDESANYVKERETGFFESFKEAFDWLYIDENDTCTDLYNIIDMLADIEVDDMKEIGANNVVEYAVLNHENMYVTNYGIIHMIG